MDSLTVDGARHGVEQISHEPPLELLAAIEGGNQVEVVVVHRGDEALQPVGFDGRGIG